MPYPSSRHQEVLLKFMKKTIENINICLANQYAVQKLLISKGVITEPDLINLLHESQKLPQRNLGAATLAEMITPDWSEYIDLEKVEEKQQALDTVRRKIYALMLPVGWESEGTQEPNIIAKKNAFHTCYNIYTMHGLLPTVVACTKENGVYIRYNNGAKDLIVETYNDGDVGALVNKEKTILNSVDIPDFNFDNCVKLFKEE